MGVVALVVFQYCFIEHEEDEVFDGNYTVLHACMDEHEGGASNFKYICNNVDVHASPNVRCKDVEGDVPLKNL